MRSDRELLENPQKATRDQLRHQLTVGVGIPPVTTPLEQEIADMLVGTIAALDDRPALVGDDDEAYLDFDVLLLAGDCLKFDGFAQRLARSAHRRPKTILWQMHALPAPSSAERGGSRLLGPAAVGPAVSRPMTRRFEWMRQHASEQWLDAVLVTTMPKKDFLDEKTIPSRFAPFGYHPAVGSDLRKERDIDVVFLCSEPTTRRDDLLKSIAVRLAASGKKLVIHEGGCFGEERTELLNRARVSLNASNAPWDVPGMRFLMSMGCGALMISESIGDPAPYIPQEHFVDAKIEDLPDVIVQYLANESARQAIVDSARRFVERDLKLESVVSRILRSC